MAIIKFTSDHVDATQLGMLPDQFVSEKQKQGNDYIKKTLDYLATVAHGQVADHNRTFVHNYNLVKGILRPADFYLKNEDYPEYATMIDKMIKEEGLPEHVQNYSLMNSPLSIMIGEQSKRPDFTKVKAFDEDSKSEELQYRTEITRQFIIQQAKAKVMQMLAMQGEEAEPEDVDQLTMDRVEEYLVSYTSLAERWANRVLTAVKAEFNFKELSEEAFRDLLISNREFFHVFADNTKTGFGVEVLNPRYVWYLTGTDKKYTSDQSGRENGAYAAGVLRVMELSEIIQRYNLPKEEIDHLRNSNKEFPGLINARRSNLRSSQTGPDTIKYDTYSPLIEQDRLLAQSGALGDLEGINSFLGPQSTITNYDNKFVVVESYHIAKKKIGLVTYIDENGDEQSTFVDENYKSVPNEVSIEWSYTNQWYKGLKIGHDVYHLEPFELLSYCPIIGVVHDIKNMSETKSFVDLLKPFQTFYNVSLNQIFKLMEKEYGNVFVRSLRMTPVPKDADPQDALDFAEEEMRRRGIIDIDDSIENTKGGTANIPFKNMDLTRSNEIQTRWQFAKMIKEEAWELVGISRARTGAIQATQTATGTQTELTQSYAQTEPYFAQHEYLINQVYQALIDAAQHIAIQTPEHTVSYISTEGEQAFLKINTDELKMRDLKVFVTSRAEDQKMFEEMRQLAQAMLQNGASLHDVAVLYSSNSIRQMMDTFKDRSLKQEAMQGQAQQMEQAKLQSEQEAIQAQIASAERLRQMEMEHESYEKELDRLSKERIAIIQATGFGKVPSEDTNSDSIPDVLELSRLAMDHEGKLLDRRDKQQDIMQKQKEMLDKNDLEREKLKVARENMDNDMKIEKMRLQAAKAKAAQAKKKPKTSK